jgi:hypothetical protein
MMDALGRALFVAGTVLLTWQLLMILRTGKLTWGKYRIERVVKRHLDPSSYWVTVSMYVITIAFMGWIGWEYLFIPVE